MDWKQVYMDLRRLNWLVLLILSFMSCFLMSFPFTMGIILGGLIIIANFHVFQHTICRAFSPEAGRKTKKTVIIGKYYLRLLALGILIYILIGHGWADPVGLVIGLSTVVIGITSFGIKRAWRTTTGEAT